MRKVAAILLLGTLSLTAMAAEPGKDWIARSNAYTQKLLDIDVKYAPEEGSSEGLAKLDKQIRDPRLSTDLTERKELKAALAKIKADSARDKDLRVQQDLAILDKAFGLRFRKEDFALAHEVPYLDASAEVFRGIHVLLDDRVAAERRSAALTRLRRYAGLETNYRPYAELLKERTLAQMAKPDVSYPAKSQVEAALSRDAHSVSDIADLFRKYGIKDWEQPYAELQKQLADYDEWVRRTILPNARTDFRLPAEKYALESETYGTDIPPARIAEMAHKAFIEIQGQMQVVAAQLAKERGYANPDYRAVIKELKKQQIAGDALLPFYENRLHAIEAIIRERNLITLPDRPVTIRLATADESMGMPAAHMMPPASLFKTEHPDEYVLPLDSPARDGGEAGKYDIYVSDAVAWALTAHEVRPGHELQFASMVERGLSLVRTLYAFNVTDAEGWGLYSEHILQPYEPADGQLLTLDLQLLRAAQAFLDPDLQSGKITPDQASRMLEDDLVLSHALAEEQVERFTFGSPGRANGAFYGYIRMLSLRRESEAALGAKFDQKKFHDFILAQGLLPPDLLRAAVLKDFLPVQK